MKTYMTPEYIFHFSSDEMRIVGLALAGKLYRKEDIAAARELNLKIAESVQRLLQERLDVAAKAHENAQDLVGGRTEEDA